jgi:LmbE family N-acetylglucosaminyl deacetylase
MPRKIPHLLHAAAHQMRKARRGLKQALSGTEPMVDGWNPARGPVLCIAAHPDDEVIGCGGTLHRHALAGDDACVVYLTRGHGSRGFPWLTPEQRGAVRELEARASSRLLGIRETVFLDGREDHLEDPDRRPEWVARVAEVLARWKPRVVYVPHAADNHRDHRAAHRILLDTAEQARPDTGTLQILQYEIWSPLSADFGVDITAIMPLKLRAIRRHKLAMDAFNYIPTIKGLAAYRCGTLLQRHGYAEAFERLKPDKPSH